MGALTFVGLGLWDEQDVSLRGAKAIRDADVVFAEWYTAFLGGASVERLAEFHGKPIQVLTREEVEKGDVVLEAARAGSVAFLAVGDTMAATTHVELRVRAQREGIPTRVVFGASITSAAAGACGLMGYKFGRTTTLVFPEGSYFPTSPYDVIRENRARGLHTLVLLDLRAGGSERENRIPGAQGPRYMRASEGAGVLLRMEEIRGEGVFTPDMRAVALARVGAPDARVAYAPLQNLLELDVGPPLHALIVPGALHFSEEEALATLASAPDAPSA